jgi:tetratricopeptide (TPR) repeat protein
MKSQWCWAIVAAIVSLFAATPSRSAAQQPSTIRDLQQLAGELKRAPDSDQLRERIIKLAAALNPRPELPEEARRLAIQADTIRKGANNRTDMKAAVEALERALALAPWWIDGYYNLGLVQELAGSLAAADRSLRFYLLGNPSEKDARQARDKGYAITAKEHLMYSQIGSGSVTPEVLLDALDGAVYDCGIYSQVLNLLRIKNRSLVPSVVYLRPFNPSTDLMVPDRALVRNGLTFAVYEDRNDTKTVSPDKIYSSSGACARIRAQ